MVHSKFGEDKRRLICPVSPELLADGPAGSMGGAGGRWEGARVLARSQ